MAGTELGNEIREGFDKMGEGVKLAGLRKNALDIAKQGYVAFRNPNAVAIFQADPDHRDWSCKQVDGEYRFYPPESKRSEILALLDDSKLVVKKEVKEESSKGFDTKSIVDIYKKELSNPDVTTFVSFSVIQGVPSRVKYRLSTSDKRTGERKIVQEFITDFDGKFSMEIIPSLYNQMMSGLPVIDVEKGEVNNRTVAFQSIDVSRQMVFTNLSEEQLSLIKNMKKFVDGQYFDTSVLEQNESNTKKH